MGNRLSKILFSNPFPKKGEVMNLKNPDLDLIRSILPECGYFGFMIRFWISPKNTQNPFSDFPTKCMKLLSQHAWLRIACTTWFHTWRGAVLGAILKSLGLLSTILLTFYTLRLIYLPKIMATLDESPEVSRDNSVPSCFTPQSL